jgi:hypothetical protein
MLRGSLQFGFYPEKITFIVLIIPQEIPEFNSLCNGCEEGKREKGVQIFLRQKLFME